eukprot:gene56780-biopygen23072
MGPEPGQMGPELGQNGDTPGPASGDTDTIRDHIAIAVKRLQTRRLTLLHLSQEKRHYIDRLKDVVNVASAVDCYQCSLKDPDHECVCPEQFPKGDHPEFTLPDHHYQAVWPAKWQEVTGKATPPSDDVLTKFHKNVAREYISMIWGEIEDRLSCSDAIQAVQIFDPRNVPFPSDPKLATYGDASLRVLLEHYGNERQESVCIDPSCSHPKSKATGEYRHKELRKGSLCPGLVDTRRCLADWPSFRRDMARGMQDGSFTDVDTFLAWFFEREYEQVYEELAKLLVVSAVLPLSSCSVERVFSAMKRIKTRLRNRLKDANLCLSPYSRKPFPLEFRLPHHPHSRKATGPSERQLASANSCGAMTAIHSVGAIGLMDRMELLRDESGTDCSLQLPSVPPTCKDERRTGQGC